MPEPEATPTETTPELATAPEAEAAIVDDIVSDEVDAVLDEDEPELAASLAAYEERLAAAPTPFVPDGATPLQRRRRVLEHVAAKHGAEVQATRGHFKLVRDGRVIASISEAYGLDEGEDEDEAAERRAAYVAMIEREIVKG